MTARLAVVTGASSGIGERYARHLAAAGHDLVIAARRGDRLEALAAELRRAHEVDVATVAVDLSTTEGVDRLVEAGEGATRVVANAGVTMAGRVGSTSWSELAAMSHLLGSGVAQLCEGLVPPMVERRDGDVVIVASIGALLPMPKSAVYSAAKSYAVAYARSLHAEVAARGVRVCAVCPGYVRTELHERSGLEHLTERIPGFMWVDAETVIDTAERGLRGGRDVVVPGAIYRAARPFLQSGLASATWRRLARRR